MRGIQDSDDIIDLVEASPGEWEWEGSVRARAAKAAIVIFGAIGCVWTLIAVVLMATDFK